MRALPVVTPSVDILVNFDTAQEDCRAPPPGETVTLHSTNATSATISLKDWLDDYSNSGY